MRDWVYDFGFKQYFSYITETGVRRENDISASNHRQALSHEVELSTPFHVWESNSQL
jgi:hypothetical protein